MASGVDSSRYWYAVVQWPVSIPLCNVLTRWRNGEGCTWMGKYVRRAGAECGYAFLTVMSLVEIVVRMALTVILIPICAVKSLQQRKMSFELIEAAYGGIFFSCLSVFINAFSLLENVTVERMFDRYLF